MRLLRLVYFDGNSIWVRATKDDLTWEDADDVIIMLAKSHEVSVELKTIDAYHLYKTGSFDENMIFTMLWNDKGTPGELANAFEVAWSFADQLN